MNWQIKGHKKQLEFLGNALERGKLAHAYVFAGPESVGKKEVALALAGELLEMKEKGIKGVMGIEGEERELKGEMGGQVFHPDLLEINSDNGIKIEQIRELIYKLSLKPYSAKYKVAIIDNADEMNIESANALLKSLEEPKSFTHIILITSNPNRLPKTILSRCQKISFGLVEGAEFEKAGGKPGLVYKMAHDKEFSEKLEEADGFYKIFNSNDLAEKLISAYEIADLETADIKNLLDSWLAKMQFELHKAATNDLAKKIMQVLLSRRFLEQNANSKLLLTNLMLSTSA